jgi:outer membrane protein OmpA-like peptidoglycan-associated protein
MRIDKRWTAAVAVVVGCSLFAGCTSVVREGGERQTQRDKTKKGAMIGAASGAVLGAVVGEGDANDILAGAAIGAGIGAGVGHYMDRQEEKLAQIPGTTVERVGENMLLVHFDSDVLFEVNSSSLNSGSRDALDYAAEVFHEFRKTAIVTQGHTDASGSETYNLDLSERRAEAVMDYLIGRGVEPTRMAAVGYGESQPVASNQSASGRSQNRRVDLLLKAKVR